MIERLRFQHMEKFFLILLLSFPLVDYIIRNWIKFGGGLWDKAVILLLVLLAIYKKLESGRDASGLQTPFLAFIVLGLTFLVFTMPTFAISFEGFRATYQFLVTFLIGYYFFYYRHDLIFAIRILLVVGVLIALYGLAQPYLGVQMPSGWVDAGEAQRFRAFSIVQSPNILGSYMAMLIPIGIGLFFAEKNKKWKVLWFILTTILLVCLLATLSRGAWLAFAAAMAFFAILIDRRALIAFIIAGILIVSFVPAVSERITYVFSETYMEKSAEDGRIARWGGALDQARSEPFFGRGLGHYGGAVAERNLGVIYVDNYYAKTLAEIGLVGLSVFLWLVGSLVYLGYKKIRETDDKQLKWLMRGMLTGLAAVLLHNGVENIFEVPFMVSYFWLIAGALLCAPLLTKKEVNQP